MNSDQIVESLRPFGTVGIYQSDRDRTFSAQITLFIPGMDAVVRSDFRHPTMQAALAQLQGKVAAVLHRGGEQQPGAAAGVAAPKSLLSRLLPSKETP